jgi:hypothetical protein
MKQHYPPAMPVLQPAGRSSAGPTALSPHTIEPPVDTVP